MNIEKDIESLSSPTNVRFSYLKKICTRYFGEPRNNGGSHYIFSMPWPGDPRINIQQRKGGKVVSYQVKQVIRALEKLRDEYGE